MPLAGSTVVANKPTAVGAKPFRPLSDVVGSRPGAGFTAPIRRAPDFSESTQSRQGRLEAFLRGQMESGERPESFTGAPMTVGQANPYGDGIDAFEPNTEIFDSYANKYSQEQMEAAAASASAGSGDIPATAGGGSPVINADGKVSSMISAAMGMVGKPYVWGGTTSAGVDCSGLIYYAFNAAGISIPRYRAVDFRNMGQSVSLDNALPGDIVYIDNPNTDTDHVGIYIGNGQMIQSPTTGQNTQVSNVSSWNVTSIRRILSDDQLGTFAAPPGSSSPTVPSYGGVTYKMPAAPTPSSGGSSQNRFL